MLVKIVVNNFLVVNILVKIRCLKTSEIGVLQDPQWTTIF